MKRLNLKKQLRREGAGDFESSDLARLGDQLGGLKFKGLSRDARNEIARIPDGKKHHYVPIKWAMAGGMAVAVISVVGFAQASKPGSALYGLKRGGEEVRTAVQPSYTDTIVEKRWEEVQQLQKEAVPDDAKVKKAEEAYRKAQEAALKRKQAADKINALKNKTQSAPTTNTQNRSRSRFRSNWNQRTTNDTNTSPSSISQPLNGTTGTNN